MRTNAASAVPELTQVAAHADVNAANRAIELLGGLGDLAASSGPTLIGLLSGTNVSARTAAAASLAHMPCCASNSIPGLVGAWRSGRLPVLPALDALSRLGCSPRAAIPSLMSLLDTGPFDKVALLDEGKANGRPQETVDVARTKA